MLMPQYLFKGSDVIYIIKTTGEHNGRRGRQWSKGSSGEGQRICAGQPHQALARHWHHQVAGVLRSEVDTKGFLGD